MDFLASSRHKLCWRPSSSPGKNGWHSVLYPFYSLTLASVIFLSFTRCLKDYSTLLLGGFSCSLLRCSPIASGIGTDVNWMFYEASRCSLQTVSFLPCTLLFPFPFPLKHHSKITTSFMMITWFGWMAFNSYWRGCMPDISIVGSFGRMDGDFGSVTDKWGFLVCYLIREVVYTFIWDIYLYIIFQSWLG